MGLKQNFVGKKATKKNNWSDLAVLSSGSTRIEQFFCFFVYLSFPSFFSSSPGFKEFRVDMLGIFNEFPVSTDNPPILSSSIALLECLSVQCLFALPKFFNNKSARQKNREKSVKGNKEGKSGEI